MYFENTFWRLTVSEFRSSDGDNKNKIGIGISVMRGHISIDRNYIHHLYGGIYLESECDVTVCKNTIQNLKQYGIISLTVFVVS